MAKENNDTMSVEYRMGEIRKVIKGMITHEHSELIADCLMEELKNTDAGIRNFMLSTFGVKTTLEDLGFSIGDRISIDTRNVSTWNWNKSEMQKKQLILNDTIEANISDYDRTKSSPIRINYQYINDDGDTKKDGSWVKPDTLKKTLL
jgi:hypothetical protein